MKKIIQISYLITFIITTFLIIRNINLGIKNNKMLIILYVISMILSLGKVFYSFTAEYMKGE